MSNQPKGKRLATWGLGAAVLIAVVLVIAIPGWRDEQETLETTSSGATSQTAEFHGGPGASTASTEGELLQSQEPSRPQEAVPVPNCWTEIQRLDQALSMDNFRTVLASALLNQDRFLLNYLQERLTRMVGNDPQTALKVLSWAEELGEGMELAVYMEALKKAPAIQHPKVSDRLLQMAENPKGPVALRAASVIGLETQKRFEPAALKRMRALALDETADQVAWNATRTIGRVMAEDFNDTGNFKAYWEQLLDISRKSEDRAVRTLALEMPTYSNPVLDAKSIDPLSEIMRTDRDREIREMAALRLSVTESPEKAVEAYRAAFAAENDFCMRWTFFRFSLRAAGPAALPVVQQFAQQDPRFQQDYLDFKEFYDRGVLDWERIWANKKLYADHIRCMDSHGEGQ
ncbi:MAG TPA: HEAT repeat domain-containing protein [Archangium sp.]|nr:HEAT repeat domain-containing protein [Archangium sp.]